MSHSCLSIHHLLPFMLIGIAFLPALSAAESAPDGSAQHKGTVSEMLQAGPIRMKFIDGELRYLKVGEKEIVRRIYFAVRDSRWDTVVPVFTRIAVQKQPHSFTISLSAVCKNDVADYTWNGEITGTAEGKITFTAGGQAEMNFQAPRIGFCVLYGAESLAGQDYALLNTRGAATPGVFPQRIGVQILTEKFHALRYTTASGMTVTCGAGNGFGMEDQRYFCDSSYKAYHSLGYPWDVAKGETRTDTLTLEVRNAPGTPVANGPAHISLGAIDPSQALPALLPAVQSKPVSSFSALVGKLEKLKDAASFTWAYNPAAHMTDNDVFMENLSTVIAQAAALRAVAPAATLRVDPINFDSPYPRPCRDPRNREPFAGAWTATLITYLARAKVNEAVFTLEPGVADVVVQAVSACAGWPMLALNLSGNAENVHAMAFLNPQQHAILWLVNSSEQKQRVAIEQLTARTVAARTLLMHTSAQAAFVEKTLPVKAGTLNITLPPFGVYRFVSGAKE